MKRARPTIALGLVLIALLAVGLAMLRSSTLLGAQIATTAALTALLIATVGAIVGSARSFWVGFAVVGWLYLVLSLGPWFSENVEPWLVSTRIFDELYVWTREPSIFRPRIHREWDGPAATFRDDFDFRRYSQMGHCLATMAHGLFGGVVGVVLARKREEPRP